MKTIVQRVKKASVTVEGKIVSEIGAGLLCLAGFKKDDTLQDIEYTLHKLIGLRIFDDKSGKMNIDVSSTKGEILIVPNFTVYASCIRGNRPDFNAAANSETGRKLFGELKISAEKYSGIIFKFGIFQASMEIELTNDGPVTVIIESSDKIKNCNRA